MKKLFLYILVTLFFCQFNTDATAQLDPGSTAPNWTLTDIDGNSHTLYTLLDEGKTVYLVFSATWCGPCWNFHNSGAFETIWNNHGPSGTNQAYTFFIESDYNTAESCLYGNCGNTLGNWTTGIDFPIINLTGSNGGSVTSDYKINYFPTVYAVCSDKRIYETGQASVSVLESYMTSCDMQESSVSTTEELCYGDGNGSIDIEVQGGVAPINYNWSNGSATQDISGITAGAYTVTMTDVNNVSYSTTINLGGPEQALDIDNNNGILQLDCHGEQTGFLSIAPVGGVSPYSALWNDGNTSYVRSDLGAGTYSVTVTDNNGCTSAEEYNISEPPELQLTLNKLDETCSQANGFIAASSTGGTGIHTYDIGQGSTSDPNFPNLTAGTYTVSVTDENNCETVNSIELMNIPGPEAVAPSSLVIDCEGSTMVIDASASNVTPGATINWTTDNGNIVSGGNTLMPTVDASGTYTLVISDPNTCDDEDEVTVEPGPDQPVSDAGSDQEINCSTPSATLGSNNSSSGNNITYAWFNESGEEVGSTQFIEVQQAGTYTLVVTNTDIDCSSSSEVEVQNTGGSVVAEASVEGNLDCNQSTVLLNGGGSSSGGNIIYEWVDSEGNSLGTELEIEVDQPGNYTLRVTDTVENCTIERSVTVEDERDEPVFDIDGANELTCDQELVTLEGVVSEPDTNYSVRWLNEAGDELSTASTLEISSPGTYTLKVTNQRTGCESEKTISISENKEVPTSSILEPEQLSCTVSEVTLDGSGSSSGSQFSYHWTTVTGIIAGPADGQTLTVEEPGEYTLTVTNLENGCSSTSTIEVIGYDEAPVGGVMIDPASLDVTFTSEVEGYYDEVLWEFGDGNTATTLDATHTYAHRGTYEVCLTLINDCGETKACRSIFVNYGLPAPSVDKSSYPGMSTQEPLTGQEKASLREYGKDSDIRLQYSPNPLEDRLLLNWENARDKWVELRVVDLNGKQVYTNQIDVTLNRQQEINAADWSSGLYILHWIGENESYSFKLIKQ